MWAALRSDLAEFVNTVAEDGTNALSAIDETLHDRIESSGIAGKSDEKVQGGVFLGDDGNVVYMDDDEEVGMPPTKEDVDHEIERLRQLKETYIVPLILSFDSKQNEKEMSKKLVEESSVSEISNSSFQDQKEHTKEEYEVETDINDADIEDEDVEYDHNKNEHDDLVKSFLLNFQLESETENISDVLKEHDSTKNHFENLVPDQVSYEEFWQRYFFRCDRQRVEMKLNNEWREKQLQQQEDTNRAFTSSKTISEFGGGLGLSKMKNLFGDVGNAVAAVSKSVQPNRSAYETASTKRTAGLASALLGGRPPFVMNTAVDSDIDDNEEEEELGWDSDDEDYDEEEDSEDENEDEGDEEVVFSSPSLSRNMNTTADSESIAIAEENVKLKEIIQNQSKEMEDLRVVISKLKNNTTPNSNEFSKIEQLETLLFEKDAEIAALNASIQDSNIANTPQKNLQSSQNISDQKIDGELRNAQSSIKKLHQAIEQMQLEKNEMEMERGLLEEKNKAIYEEMQQYSRENEKFKKEIQHYRNELEKKSNELKEMEENARINHQEQKQHQQHLQQNQLESDSLPSSNSSCVKVEQEDQKTSRLLDNIDNEEDEADEDDEWGDGWGDDDDI